MITWIKKNVLIILCLIIIAMLIPTMLRGFKLDLTSLLNSFITAFINGVAIYYDTKLMHKAHEENKHKKD